MHVGLRAREAQVCPLHDVKSMTAIWHPWHLECGHVGGWEGGTHDTLRRSGGDGVSDDYVRLL